jgi:hypothetical protein
VKRWKGAGAVRALAAAAPTDLMHSFAPLHAGHAGRRTCRGIPRPLPGCQIEMPALSRRCAAGLQSRRPHTVHLHRITRPHRQRAPTALSAPLVAVVLQLLSPPADRQLPSDAGPRELTWCVSHVGSSTVPSHMAQGAWA